MKCRPGDLAIVVHAVYRCNVGRIVKVVALHDGKGVLTIEKAGPVWLVECGRRMKWTVRGKTYRRRKGPVPDAYLRPIRGLPPGTRTDRPVELEEVA